MINDLHFMLACPKCFQQDHLPYAEFKSLVLDDESGKVHPVSGKRVSLPEKRIEGQYPCPYGCGVAMGIIAIGTEDEVDVVSEGFFKKYFDKLPKGCTSRVMMGLDDIADRPL